MKPRPYLHVIALHATHRPSPATSRWFSYRKWVVASPGAPRWL